MCCLCFAIRITVIWVYFCNFIRFPMGGILIQVPYVMIELSFKSTPAREWITMYSCVSKRNNVYDKIRFEQTLQRALRIFWWGTFSTVPYSTYSKVLSMSYYVTQAQETAVHMLSWSPTPWVYWQQCHTGTTYIQTEVFGCFGKQYCLWLDAVRKILLIPFGCLCSYIWHCIGYV